MPNWPTAKNPRANKKKYRLVFTHKLGITNLLIDLHAFLRGPPGIEHVFFIYGTILTKLIRHM